MKIATWNIARPRSSSGRNGRILAELKRIDADIVVLTETNSAVQLGEGYNCCSTSPLDEASSEGVEYTKGEHRVAIWTRCEVLEKIVTYNPRSAVCVRLATHLGPLIVYGSVIGYRGNRHQTFKDDLAAQRQDWERLGKAENICIAGDLNLSFSDNYYFTQSGREGVLQSFSDLKIYLVTVTQPEKNVNHVAISEAFLKSYNVNLQNWNFPPDKKLSDHQGVCVTLKES